MKIYKTKFFLSLLLVLSMIIGSISIPISVFADTAKTDPRPTLDYKTIMGANLLEGTQGESYQTIDGIKTATNIIYSDVGKYFGADTDPYSFATDKQSIYYLMEADNLPTGWTLNENDGTITGGTLDTVGTYSFQVIVMNEMRPDLSFLLNCCIKCNAKIQPLPSPTPSPLPSPLPSPKPSPQTSPLPPTISPTSSPTPSPPPSIPTQSPTKKPVVPTAKPSSSIKVSGTKATISVNASTTTVTGKTAVITSKPYASTKADVQAAVACYLGKDNITITTASNGGYSFSVEDEDFTVYTIVSTDLLPTANSASSGATTVTITAKLSADYKKRCNDATFFGVHKSTVDGFQVQSATYNGKTITYEQKVSDFSPFMIFAIIKDTNKKAGNTGRTPETGDTIQFPLWIALLCISGSGLAGLLWKKRGLHAKGKL